VQSSTCNICQIESRRASPAHAVRGHRQLMVEMHIDILMPLAAGETGRDQALPKEPVGRNPNPALVQISPPAQLSGEHLLARWVKHDSGDHFSRTFQRQRDIKDRKPMRKVGGSVERIYIPAIFGIAYVPATLFGENLVRRKSRPQALDY